MPDKVLVMRIENGKIELSEPLEKFSVWPIKESALRRTGGNVALRCHIPGCPSPLVALATQEVGLHQLVKRAMDHLKGHP